MRIPEVLSEIRKIQWMGGDPLTSFLQWKGLPATWVEAVQRGLFLRLRRQKFQYAGLIKRRRWPQDDQLEAILLPILQARSLVQIFVVGPGFDDLHVHIRKLQQKYRLHCEVEFCDVIGADAKLTWFWPEIREADLKVSGAPFH